MGTGSSKLNQLKNLWYFKKIMEKEDTPLNNNESVLDDENIKTETEVNNESKELTVLEKVTSVIKNNVDFFSQPYSTKQWACEKGRTLAKKLTNLYMKNKEKETRLEITELFLNHGIVELFNRYLSIVLTDITEIFTEDENILQDEIKTLNKQEETIETKGKIVQLQLIIDAQNIIGSMIIVLLNSTNVNEAFSMECLECGVIKTMLDYQSIFYPLIQETGEKNWSNQNIRENGRVRIFSYSMGILHNLSKFKKCKDEFKKHDAINKTLPYLKSVTQLFAMKALMLLSYLIDEQNNHLIMSSEDPIKLLIKYLKGAVKNDNHRYMGFGVSELIESLGLIAKNDNNKETIGKNDAISTISLVLAFASDDLDGQEEILQSCQTLWVLAFNDDNKKRIKKDQIIISYLYRLKSCEISTLRRAACGTLWEVEHNKPEEIEKDNKTPHTDGHIMISYQWCHQSVMIKVKDMLQHNGYKVWMDVDQMGGSTLEAMAKAVEEASFIIVSVSTSYKDSPNCRSEAEYAYQLKRTIVPLMMEENYTPDGWLGFIVGAKFWIDFKSSANEAVSLDSLLREVRKLMKDNFATADNTNDTNYDVTTKAPAAVGKDNEEKGKRTEILKWTTKQVKAWLKEIKIENFKDIVERNNLNGSLLIRIYDVRKESADFFYRIIREDFNLTLLDVFKFVDELEKLFSP